MKEYILKLKELINNFSYQELINLLKSIDNDIITGKISNINEEFLYLFNYIMNYTNDSVLLDETPITLGNVLINGSLINKEKLSPTLILYFFLNQKNKIGLERHCNKISFSTSEKPYHMQLTTLHTDNSFSLEINWNHYIKETNQEQFNYKIMHDILHETTHIYQGTRLVETTDLFEKLTYYDNKITTIILQKILKGGTNSGNAVVHASLPTEFMADEQADIYMLQIAKTHPEYFSHELYKKNLEQYKQSKDTSFTSNPRQSLNELLEYFKDQYRRISVLQEMNPIFEEIDSIKNLETSIIEELKKQDISEEQGYYYYNIFLDSIYRFDGNRIIMQKDELNTNISK